jgi:hypothetical protein
MRKNVASQKIGVQMVSATDGSAFTGSVTVYVTGDAGTQAVGSVSSGACTHEGEGYHTYAPAQAETNYDLIAFTFKGTGAVPVTIQVFTISYDPHDTNDLGLVNLTGHTPQTGDSFARIGATGSGLTSLAPSATALSTVQWTNARAGYLDNINNANLSSVPLFPTNFATLGINASGHVSRVTLVDTTTTNTDMISQANVRTAVGLASANLDSQFTSLSSSLGGLITTVGVAGAGLTSIPNSAGVATLLTRITEALTNTTIVTAMFTVNTGEVAGDAVAGSAVYEIGELAASGGLTVEDIREEIDANSTRLLAIYTDTNELQVDLTNGGRLDLLIDAIKAKTDSLTFTSAGKVDATLQAAADIAAAVCTKLAAIILRRTMANIEGDANGDTLNLSSLYGLIQQAQESAVSGGTLTVKQTDGSTTLGTKTVVSSAGADPITGIS